ncbi:hypothetical protein A3860_16685 [Niastella vici]|uniref:Sulfatase N-terminal domain-containing protein n=2 Tax=Niastella vici TaxID=1703345 RepID=A0A1V9G435_9BACT|nr:hypothetical protein A3860_16685 [Niastella vici]
MEMQKQKIGKWLLGALLILVVPNCLFWILEPKVSLSRGVFVAEYLLIACLYPLINRKLFITIWILFAVYDLVYATSSLFFMDFMEMVHALAKIPELALIDWLKWGGLLILFILIIFTLVKGLIRYEASYRIMHLRFLWPLIVLAGVVFFVSKKEIVSVPTWSVVKAVQHAVFVSTAKHNIDYLGSAAKTVFWQEPAAAATNKEALILVESWGLLTDQKLHSDVVQPLYELVQNHQYTIREGTASYKYLTQAGEFRELTGCVFHYYLVRDKWVKDSSLLIKKQEQGYHVIGVHGNTSKFYRRNVFWPVLGVQEMYFIEQLNTLQLPLCGSNEFRGICDTVINTWLLNNMNRQPDRKEFYYWVTLNTHLPLVEVHDEAYNNFARQWKEQGITENTLQMAYQQKGLFRDLAGKLSKPGSPKAHILLVGDHAPPFIDPADRKMYDANRVPYIELIPN